MHANRRTGFLLSQTRLLGYPSPLLRCERCSRKDSSMMLFRKLLIGAATLVGIAVCLTATVMVVKACRNLARRDGRDNEPAGWIGLGTPYGFGFPGTSSEPPGIARVAGFGETGDDDEA